MTAGVFAKEGELNLSPAIPNCPSSKDMSTTVGDLIGQVSFW